MLEALVVDALATYRLTRLVTKDHLTADARGVLVATAYEATDTPPRGSDRWTPAEWIDHARVGDPNPPAMARIVTCSWCAGVWVAAGVIAARTVAPRPWGLVARVLAAAAVAGFLAANE